MNTIAISGAGLVGCCAACALADAGLQVLLIERQPKTGVDNHAAAALDERPVVVSAASARVLDQLGGWSRLKSLVEPIRRIHVSEQGRSGMVRLNAASFDLTAFGYVVDAKTLAVVLKQMIGERSTAITFFDVTVRHVSRNDKSVTLSLERANGACQMISAALLVAADGGDSPLRQEAGIGITRHAIAQQALVCTITLANDHQQQAFERFTASGPIALLPLCGQRYGVVWSLPVGKAAALAAQDEASFCSALQNSFGGRLGSIRAVSARRVHSLRSITSHIITAQRMVLIGNAAQELHPVAGQGFNLGVRDAVWLADSCTAVQRQRLAIGSLAHLQHYAASRAADRRWARHFTQGLVGLFSNRLFPLTWLRGFGLHAMATLPLLQWSLVSRASGLAAIPARYRLPKMP